MTTLRISITKEVLEATKDCRSMLSRNCAISFAVRLIWPYAATCPRYIYPYWRIGKENLRMPHGQANFIGQFDRATPAKRAAMQPFSFEIEVPDEVIGEVNIDEIRRICEGSKTLELVK